jgi:ankyrin repeat protein
MAVTHRIKIDQRLVTAVESGNRQRVVKCIVEKGANVNGQDSKGSTAMHIAARSNQWGCFTELVQRHGNLELTDSNGDTALNVAIKHHHDTIWKIALRACPAAARMSDNMGKTPLHNADAEAVDVLLESRADINARTKDGETALYLAASSNDTEKALRLLARQAQVNIVTHGPRNTALHLAAAQNNVRLVESLLDHNADPSIQDSRGRTPLHYAAQIQSIAVLRLLVAKVHPGSKLIRDMDGRSPVHFIHSLPDAVGLLADKRHAVLDQRDNTGLTPLHLASRSATPEVVKALIDHGASIGTQDKDGWTPAEALCRDKRFWMPKGSSNASPEGVMLCSGSVIDNTLSLSEGHRLNTLALLLDKWRDPSASCRAGLLTWKKSWSSRNGERKRIIHTIELILEEQGGAHNRTLMKVGGSAAAVVVVGGAAFVGTAPALLVGVAGGVAGIGYFGYKTLKDMSKKEMAVHGIVYKFFGR